MVRHRPSSATRERTDQGADIDDAAPSPDRHEPARQDRRRNSPARLPARAALLGLAGLIAGGALAAAAGLIAATVAPDSRLLRLVLAQAALWAGMLLGCWAASRRFGTGRLGADFGVEVRGSDWLRGLGLAVLDRLAATAVVAVLLALFGGAVVGSNATMFEVLREDKAALVAFALIATVGAPTVEELFFRGLLLQALSPRLGGPGAIAAQALLFGLAHASPTAGLRNVSVVLGTAVLGAIHGLAVARYGRLGPAMTGHALFNLGTTLVIALR